MTAATSLTEAAIPVPAGARYHGLAVTREEYLDLPEDGFKYDMIAGVLYVSPSAGFDHGSSNGRFYYFLTLALEKNPVGRATIETDLLLPDGGDVLRPDVCFIRKENLKIIKKHVHGVPDLVCEVLSESTRKRDLKEKAERYLKNTFTAGEVVSASKINENFQIAAPEGFNGAFYLLACPSGWVAADGTNSTPDLRGRFIRACAECELYIRAGVPFG